VGVKVGVANFFLGIR